MTAGRKEAPDMGRPRLRTTPDVPCSAVSGQAHADMMIAMAKGNSTDPVAGDRQRDLFNDHAGIGGEVFRPLSVTAPRPSAAALTDGELIAMLSQADRLSIGIED